MRASGLVARRLYGNPGDGIVFRARSALRQPVTDWLSHHLPPNEGSLTQKMRTWGGPTGWQVRFLLWSFSLRLWEVDHYLPGRKRPPFAHPSRRMYEI